MANLPTLAQVVGKAPGVKGAAGPKSLPSLNDVISGKDKNLPSWSPSSLPSWADANSAKPAEKHHDSGGLLGTLERIPGAVAHDLYDTAVHSPQGMFELSKAIVKAQMGNPDDLIKIAKATGKGFLADVEHPLRHPGNTLLDVGSVFSLGAGTAARVGEVGRVATAGEGAAAVARAALKGPKPEARMLEHDGAKVSAGVYSRSASYRQAQKLFDKFHQRFPEIRPLPFGVRTFPERIAKELQKDNHYRELLGRAPARELVKLGKGLSTPQQVALRVVAEGVPIADRIAFHERALPHLTGRLAKATSRQVELLKLAAPYVHDVHGVDAEGNAAVMPRINPEHADLAHIYEKAKSVAHQRETILGDATKVVRDGKGGAERVKALGDEAAAGRVVAPAEIIHGDQVAAHFNPDLLPELFRVPYAKGAPKAALFKPAGWKGGNERAPASVRKGFTGALLRGGMFRNDTTRLVGESYLEAHRFGALISHRDEFLRLAHDAPVSEHDVPIRMDSLKDKPWPNIVQKYEDHNNLKPEEVQALGHAYESLRQDLFPDKHQFELEPEAHPDVKWIDSRLLGGINEPNPLVGVVGAGKKLLSTFDTINNAERLAILYLKPAYAVPNMVGNAALSIVQQGWAAPRNLAVAARLNAKLGPELASKIDLIMGEGMTAALHTSEGPLQKVTNKAANVWQAAVDTPFRRAAFIHEARRFGYKTPAQIKALFDDPHALGSVAREANGELIDYGRLGRYERDIIRRVIFFYPWVKGSSVYAGRFLATHPQQAALVGQLGKQGAAANAADFPHMPSYLEGAFKTSPLPFQNNNGGPYIVNPTAAGILQTPAQLLKTGQEVFSGHPGQAFQIARNFTPAVQAGLDLVGASQRRKGQSPVSAAGNTLVGGLPIVSLIQGLMNPPAGSTHPRVMPRDRRDVILKYLIGGLAPAPYNKAAGERAAYRETHPR